MSARALLSARADAGARSAKRAPPLALAVQRAARDDRLLVVYLHAPYHEDTKLFCRRTLFAPPTRAWLARHALLWCGSLSRGNGRQVSELLRATAYPFLACLSCRASAGGGSPGGRWGSGSPRGGSRSPRSPRGHGYRNRRERAFSAGSAWKGTCGTA